MVIKNLRGICIILLTLFLAFMLNILPLPYWAIWLRPEWVVLVMLYWVIALPHRFGIGWAWLIGLLFDALNGTLLGEHALAFALIAYCAIKIHRQLRVFPLWQQAMVIFILLLVYEIFTLLIQVMLADISRVWWFWPPALTSMLLWPWLFILLRDCRRRFKID
ncbi:MAG: rod shape-determining protein MreD [Gammaproteobacteria bacterium]